MASKRVFGSLTRRAARFLGKKANAVRRDLAGLIADMGKTGLISLTAFLVILIFIGAFSVSALEGSRGNASFKDPLDGLWWAIVTVVTVGYGDKYPASRIGQAVAMVYMLVGFVCSALVSGTVASIFVERRIREGKGLRDLKLKGHVILCGWNRGVHKVLSGFAGAGGHRKTAIVLVNDREGDWFDSLKAEYPALDLKYVRGAFWDENVLTRASVMSSRAVVIIPDESGGEGFANADERSLLAALSCQSLNPELPVTAEILREENSGHMKRAGVRNLVVKGEFSPFLLSSVSSGNGVPEAARRMLSPGTGLRLARIPQQLVGKTFLEASAHFMKTGSGLMVGLLSEEKGVSLEDLISDDSSAIDAFIKRKFKESSLDLDQDGESGGEIRLNPGPDSVIRERDSAFVLG